MKWVLRMILLMKVKWKLKMNNKNLNSIYNESGITIKQLKDFIKNLPEKNEHNEDYEIWLETGKNLSSPSKSICFLNSREKGSDILLGLDEDFFRD